LSASINPGILPNAATPASHPDRRALLIQIAAVQAIPRRGRPCSLARDRRVFLPAVTEAAQDEDDVSAAPLKELTFREMHDLADMFEGWAQDRQIAESPRAERKTGTRSTLVTWLKDIENSVQSRPHVPVADRRLWSCGTNLATAALSALPGVEHAVAYVTKR